MISSRNNGGADVRECYITGVVRQALDECEKYEENRHFLGRLACVRAALISAEEAAPEGSALKKHLSNVLHQIGRIYE